MKQFFGAFFGSIVGILLATLLSVLLVVALVKAGINSALRTTESEKTGVMAASILKIDLEGDLVERERDNPFEQIEQISPLIDASGMGLNGLLRKIRSAATDDKIKGIYLRFQGSRAGLAALQEVRAALEAFRKSGKFVYAYGEFMKEREYFLASVADKVILHPAGMIEWKGLGMNLLFFKNMFEKLNVDMQIFKVGKFKSAVEPYMLDHMSEANREQCEVMLNSIWNNMLSDIARSRNISTGEMNKMANELSIRSAQGAVGKLVDASSYEDEVFDEMKGKLGVKKEEKVPFIDYFDYSARPENGKPEGKIAVVYADGQIISGDGPEHYVTSERMASALRQARKDDHIKAIVLRVNSPGGSALASDVIWREVLLANKVKPTVVSMGDYAASGGYYISCAADRIFAQPNTITGSIGVFGVLPSLQRMLENKLGVTIDTVNTNKHSDFGSALRAADAQESEYLQSMVEDVYTTFTTKVAEGRKLNISRVDSIGQGRVWTGSDALKLGLVDELGGLEDALAYAAKKAGLAHYRVTELPRLKGPLEGIFNKGGSAMQERALSSALGDAYPYYMQLREALDSRGVQARLPFNFVLR